MSKKVLVATEKPFAPAARDQLVAVLEEAGYQVARLESYTDRADLLSAVADAHALIVRSDKINAEVLAAAKELALIVRAGAGYDNIDGASAKERGVLVMNTPGQNSNAVAELVLSMMVYMARGQFGGKPGTELRGKTLGIHAFGNVGRAVARVAAGFGMDVLAFDPFVPADKMAEAGVTSVEQDEELYRKSLYVSIHMPKTDKTIRSVGRRLLSLLPEGGTLLNSARSEVIHEEEILALLTERTDLRYATDIQPSPEIHAALKEACGVRYFATPKKMGAQTFEANLNAGLTAARQIVGFFERGERPNVVNP